MNWFSCCTTRDKPNQINNEEFDHFSPNIPTPLINNKYGKSVYNSAKKSMIQYGSAQKAFLKQTTDTSNDHEDTQKLYQAKIQKDIKNIVKFLNNDTKLVNSPPVDHPWAESPKTNGSLAAILLAQLFIRIDQDQLGVTEQQVEDEIILIRNYTNIIIQQNTIQMIKSNLRSSMIDRQELTILFCVFLLQENPEAQEYFIQNKIMEEFEPYLFHTLPQQDIKAKNELRVAALQCCRELFKGRLKIIEQFMNGAGAKLLLLILQIDDDMSVFEGLNAIDELSQIPNTYFKNQKVLKKFLELNFMTIIDKIIEKSNLPFKKLPNMDEDMIEEAVENKENVLKYARYIKSLLQSPQLSSNK